MVPNNWATEVPAVNYIHHLLSWACLTYSGLLTHCEKNEGWSYTETLALRAGADLPHQKLPALGVPGAAGAAELACCSVPLVRLTTVSTTTS